MNILSGSVTSPYAAVWFAGGATNTLNNRGTVGDIATLDALAVRGTGGDDVINNAGRMAGNVILGDGANAFNNYVSGLLASGTTIDLGSGNLFTNAGVLSPGSTGSLVTTLLNGSLVQTSSGRYNVNFNLQSGQADRINVSETANLAGTVVVTAGQLASGPHQAIILSAAGGTTDSGLSVVAPWLLQATLQYPNANDVVLTTNLDFAAAAAALNRNQTSIAQYLQGASANGGGGLTPVLSALLNLSDAASYRAALDQLSPEIYGQEQIAALFASQTFTNDLLSCKTVGEDGASIAREGQCLWVRGRARA